MLNNHGMLLNTIPNLEKILRDSSEFPKLAIC
jgi:hypothetical protein